MSYATVQAIREGAGLLSRVNNEKPAGAVNSSNRVFVVRRRPIVDSDNDDEVTVADAQAFVDEVPVTVQGIDPATGKITLTTAPTTGSIVTVDYCFSPITDDYVAGKQQEADAWVDMKIKGSVKVPLNPVPGIICTVAEMYAAGLILTRDWGSRVDSELTSKDGFNKIKQARALIDDYLQGIEAEKKLNNHSNGNNDVSGTGGHDVFSRHLPVEEPGLSHHGVIQTTDDEWFMRRDC